MEALLTDGHDEEGISEASLRASATGPNPT
jgi:hypothetical protein